MTTLTWTYQSTNPNDPTAWGWSNAIPTNIDDVVFPWGEISVDDVAWSAGSVSIEGGSVVDIPQFPQGASLNASNGTILNITATSPITLSTVIVGGGSIVNISGPVTIAHLSVHDAGQLILNYGATITHLDGVYGAGILDVSGTLIVDGKIVPQFGDVSSVFGNRVHDAGMVIHESGSDPCFVVGTKVILGSGDPCDVADLRVGMEVCIFDPRTGCLSGVKPIAWVGRGKTCITTDPRPSFAGYPVKCGDARVTPEHCVFVGGSLVPAHLMVGYGDWKYDMESFHVDDVYEYVHFRLERHGIVAIVKDATTNALVLVETLLDTGHHGRFDASQPVLAGDETWDNDACAPLLTDIRAISHLVGSHRVPDFIDEYTGATSISIATDIGETYVPYRAKTRSNGCVAYTFSVRPDVRRLTILSDTCAMDSIIADSDDRRIVGLHVVEMFIDTRTLLLDTSQSGWYTDGWTNGYGRVFLPDPVDPAHTRILTIVVKPKPVQ